MASWLRCNKTRFGSAAAGYGAGRMANRIVLTPNPGSVAVARRWTTDQTNQLGFSDLAETAALLVSELVTNAVLHAETECELTVRAHRGGIRVEVIDGSDEFPVGAVDPDPLALSGRGMLLVDALSSAHGSAAVPGGGKLVWFEIENLAEQPQ